MNKPKFSEEEIEEMCDVYHNTGYITAVQEILKYLEKDLNYSNVHNTVTEIRKEFRDKRCRELYTKIGKNFPNSTLQDTLLKRIK